MPHCIAQIVLAPLTDMNNNNNNNKIAWNNLYIYILYKKITAMFASSMGIFSIKGMTPCNLLLHQHDFESKKTWSANYVNINESRPHVVRFGKVKSGLPSLHILNKKSTMIFCTINR